MKLEHRCSFFIFQLSEKMNDPNIHAFYKLFKHCAKTYVRTGLGNLIWASNEPSEVE